MLLEKENGPRRYAVIDRRWVGKDAGAILRAAGIPCDPATRLAVCEVDLDHPFLWTEMMMPVIGLARVRTVDDAIDFALEVEQGKPAHRVHALAQYREASRMARLCDCSIFVTERPERRRPRIRGEGVPPASPSRVRPAKA